MRLNLPLLLLALLSAPLPTHSAEDLYGQGKLIFAIQLLETAEHRIVNGSEYPKERTGVFYYCKESAAGECELNTFTGYKMVNGKLEHHGDADVSLLKELKAIPLSSFDVQKEIDSTIANGRAEARKNGRSFPMWSVADGAKYRILYDFNGVHVDYTAWNPRYDIKKLAAYSPRLKSLNDLLDLIALDYGRSQLW